MGTGVLVLMLVILGVILGAAHVAIKHTIVRTIVVTVVGLVICIVIHTTPSVILGIMLISMEVLINAGIKTILKMRDGNNTPAE